MTNPDECKHYQRLLQTHRENYRVYEGQMTTLGAFAPPYMHISLKEAQEGIIKCKKMLRQLGCPVKDELSDPDVEENGGSAPAQEPSTQRIDFAILTALPEERRAVINRLGSSFKRLPSTNDDIHTYYQGTVESIEGNQYNVVVTNQVSMGRVQASTAASSIIRTWKPRYLLLVGIAAGIQEKGVQLGDILLSQHIVDYELQKFTNEGIEHRGYASPGDARLLNAAQNIEDNEWVPFIQISRPIEGQPQVHVGSIASGDKVIANKAQLDELRQQYPRLIGIEMEGGGASVAALQTEPRPNFFMIRGVSDFADEQKNDVWRGYACDVAAAFTYALIRSGLLPHAL
jgi:nucleoside phosphorylase